MDKQFYLDEITWNDLNLEEIYNRMNCASSSVGMEYLKKTLHTLELSEERLTERDSKAESLKGNESLRTSLNKVFKGLGKTKKTSFLDHIFKIHELKEQGNAVHYILILLLLASIALIFISPAIGIIALVVMIAVNIGLYFKFRSGVEAYFNSLKYLVSMVVCASKLLKLKLPDAFSKETEVLKESVRVFTPLKRGSWLITNSVSGSLIDVIMDYIRMIFHVDLIKFNNMKKCAMAHEEEIKSLYEALGEIELAICICTLREEKEGWCRPQFTEKAGLQTEEAWHPLVRVPVKNSLKTTDSILLTGSNASGKSTFLKTIAINQILAQTIYTVFADSLVTRFYQVLSSMALNDNLLGEESYFIVEIKSLKRIFDTLDPEVPVLAFVDEVLRGTNTAERIAASTQLLKRLSKENALIFAATHDKELTDLLKDDMRNFHFSEQVEGEQVVFDYKLKEGGATSRNALKLLKAYGFDPEMVAAAEKQAEEFG